MADNHQPDPSILLDLLSLIRPDPSREDINTLCQTVRTWQESQTREIWDKMSTLFTPHPAAAYGPVAEAFDADPAGTYTGFSSIIAADPRPYMPGLQRLFAADPGLLRQDFMLRPILAIGEEPLLRMQWESFLRKQGWNPVAFWGTLQQMEANGRSTRHETAQTGFECEISSTFDPTDDPNPEWLVDGMLPRGGFSVLGAKPKVGKTTWGFSLGWAIARGLPFLGRDTTQGRVLHFAMEGVRQQDVITLHQMHGHDDHLVRFGQQLPSNQYDVLAKTIEAQKINLVIIDTIFRFAKIADMNDYGQVTNAFARLIELCQTTGCHIMAVHHLRKTKGEDVGDQLLGSTAIYGSVDTYIDYQWKDADDEIGDRVMFTRQRYGLGMPKTLIGLDVETGRIVSRGTVGSSRQSGIAQLVLDALPPSGTPVAQQELVSNMKARREDVFSAIKLLVSQGLMGQEKYGRTTMVWAIEPAGNSIDDD